MGKTRLKKKTHKWVINATGKVNFFCREGIKSGVKIMIHIVKLDCSLEGYVNIWLNKQQNKKVRGQTVESIQWIKKKVTFATVLNI